MMVGMGLPTWGHHSSKQTEATDSAADEDFLLCARRCGEVKAPGNQRKAKWQIDFMSSEFIFHSSMSKNVYLKRKKKKKNYFISNCTKM